MHSLIEEIMIAYQLFVWQYLKETDKESEFYKIEINKVYTEGCTIQVEISFREWK